MLLTSIFFTLTATLLGLFLIPSTNTLGIGINTSTGNDDSSGNFNFYYIENISLQKWNCLIISVNSRTLDIYLDGKLVNSYVMQGVYLPNKFQSVYLGNNGQSNFLGYISRVRYQENPIDPEQAYAIYKEGISSAGLDNFLNKYKLKVSFYEKYKEDQPIFEYN